MSEPIDIDEGRRLLAAIEGPCTCDSGIGCFYHDAKADLSIWLVNNAAALLDAQSELATARQQLAEWQTACEQNRDDLEAWHGVASAVGVPNWDGTEYSSPENWSRRVFARIAALEKQLAECQRERDAARREIRDEADERLDWPARIAKRDMRIVDLEREVERLKNQKCAHELADEWAKQMEQS